MPANKKFEFDIKSHMGDNFYQLVKAAVLEDTLNLYIDVTLKKHKTYHGIVYTLYRHTLHDDHPESQHNALGAHDDFIGEWPEDEEADALAAFEQAAQGLVRCNYCGQWLKIEDAMRWIPSGISCKNDKCVKQGKEDQAYFFDCPLD